MICLFYHSRAAIIFYIFFVSVVCEAVHGATTSWPSSSGLTASLLASQQPATATVPFEVKRLNQKKPIISKALFDEVGAPSYDASSINGPSLIRVPSWVQDKADPSAVYYCYFGHHHGKYIRMAWAATLEGPWTLFNAYNRTSSKYPGRGVLDLIGPAQDSIQFTNGDTISVGGHSHVSSPYVVVDDAKKRILLFFHTSNHNRPGGTGWFDTKNQRTMVATSKTGLNFNGGMYVKAGGVEPGESGMDATGEGFGIKNTLLGNAYFSVFSYQNRLYAFTNYGPLWAAPASEDAKSPLQLWERSWETVQWDPKSHQMRGGGNPIWTNLHSHFLNNTSNNGEAVPPRYYAGSPEGPRKGAPRHFATRMQNDGTTLEVYYSSRGEKPERIFRTTMTLDDSRHFSEWETVTSGTPEIHDEVLRPEEVWEGIKHTPSISKDGAETDVQAVRDPFVFNDVDGRSYILYSGNPESAIGIASLNNLPIASLRVSRVDRNKVTFSYESLDTDGKIVEYLWDWGDGNIHTHDDSSLSNGVHHGSESHTYEQAGQYNVSLTVYDDTDGTFTTYTTVNVVLGMNDDGRRIMAVLLVFCPFMLFVLLYIRHSVREEAKGVFMENDEKSLLMEMMDQSL